ncbi:MAG: hypothetical protein GY862_37605 [Gammaproteobacteria bacterium]|nr:hypothetical protein [Gammaproteobacteria bacterium]
MVIKYEWFFLLAFCFGHADTLAFADVYEPDDSFEQANAVVIGDDVRRLHTLHNGGDEDWFKFYATADTGYELEVKVAGEDINVAFTLLRSDGSEIQTVNDAFAGEREMMFWRAPLAGIYYVKVTDETLQAPVCRTNIQYEFRIFIPDAPSMRGFLEGRTIDAVSGEGIADVTVCDANNCALSLKDAVYKMSFPVTDTYELIADVAGYKPLTCRVLILELGRVYRNFPLIPAGQSIPAPFSSQSVYRNGENLRISLPFLPEGCVRYHLGLAYPDGKLFIISELVDSADDLAPFVPNSLPVWTGGGNIAVDMMITNDMPRGQYSFYLLRVPEGFAPLAHPETWEFSMAGFSVE